MTTGLCANDEIPLLDQDFGTELEGDSNTNKVSAYVGITSEQNMLLDLSFPCPSNEYVPYLNVCI